MHSAPLEAVSSPVWKALGRIARVLSLIMHDNYIGALYFQNSILTLTTPHNPPKQKGRIMMYLLCKQSKVRHKREGFRSDQLCQQMGGRMSLLECLAH